MGLAEKLLIWFDNHGRKTLPWQQEKSPYRVWISEIMLQQTQVATVVPYYERFMASFPDIATLAAAAESAVLAHWSGLGYYSRARNLHKAAEQIVAEHGGRFPSDIEAVMALPGIGRSTAGAILAIACGQRQPILDGNVKRVLTRYHAIAGWPGERRIEQRLWALAEEHTPTERVGDYTQAIMDLGATLCRRSRPDCAICPLNSDCRARAADEVALYPGKKPRKEKPVRTTTMLLLAAPDGAIALEQRPPSGIWGGLWSLPELAEGESLEEHCRTHGLEIIGHHQGEPFRHSFSHYHLDITPLFVEVQSADPHCVMEVDRRVWYKSDTIYQLGLPAPIRRLLEQWHKQQEQIDDANG